MTNLKSTSNIKGQLEPELLLLHHHNHQDDLKDDKGSQSDDSIEMKSSFGADKTQLVTDDKPCLISEQSPQNKKKKTKQPSITVTKSTLTNSSSPPSSSSSSSSSAQISPKQSDLTKKMSPGLAKRVVVIDSNTTKTQNLTNNINTTTTIATSSSYFLNKNANPLVNSVLMRNSTDREMTPDSIENDVEQQHNSNSNSNSNKNKTTQKRRNPNVLKQSKIAATRRSLNKMSLNKRVDKSLDYTALSTNLTTSLKKSTSLSIIKSRLHAKEQDQEKEGSDDFHEGSEE
jgi:hypothetical protein